MHRSYLSFASRSVQPYKIQSINIIVSSQWVYIVQTTHGENWIIWKRFNCEFGINVRFCEITVLCDDEFIYDFYILNIETDLSLEWIQDFF